MVHSIRGTRSPSPGQNVLTGASSSCLDRPGHGLYYNERMIPYKRKVSAQKKESTRIVKSPSISPTELMVLTALSTRGEQYGLELRESVSDLSSGKIRISLGGLYPTLHRMERKGIIAAKWGDTTEIRRGARRRYYRLTGLGVRALDDAKRMFTIAWRASPQPG